MIPPQPNIPLKNHNCIIIIIAQRNIICVIIHTYPSLFSIMTKHIVDYQY